MNRLFLNFSGILYLGLFFLFTLPQNLFPQITSHPFTSEEIRAEFDQAYFYDQVLVSGKLYQGYQTKSAKGNPFVIDEEWKNGTVKINGKIYSNLLLKYDLVSNVLVMYTLSLNNLPFSICLNPDNLSEFSIGEKIFIRLEDDISNDIPRFYELLVDGEISLLYLTSKDLVLSDNFTNSYEYKESRKSFLLVGKELIEYKGLRTLNRLFPQLRKDIEEFVNSEGILADENIPTNDAEIIAFCNSIINKYE